MARRFVLKRDTTAPQPQLSIDYAGALNAQQYAAATAAGGPVLVVASLDVAQAILLEASLGFFGLGDPNLPSWGGMLNTAQDFVQRAWWMSVFPGIGITLSVLGFNVLGDGLTETYDPRVSTR